MRFTRKNRQRVLDNNEGFSADTNYRSRNFREHRHYEIREGKLHVRAKGKTSWADSHFDNTYEYGADDEVTKRFLRKHRDDLNCDEE